MKWIIKTVHFPWVVLGLAFLTACDRQDMYEQPKYEPLQPSELFNDGRSARPLEPGRRCSFAAVHRDGDPSVRRGALPEPAHSSPSVALASRGIAAWMRGIACRATKLRKRSRTILSRLATRSTTSWNRSSRIFAARFAGSARSWGFKGGHRFSARASGAADRTGCPRR